VDVSQLLDPELNWERILKSAEHHRLLPALNTAIGGYAKASDLRARARRQAWRAMLLTAELARIAAAFRTREIQFLAYKGPALSQLLYGNSAMRQFGDLDLLVRPRDVARAKTVLLELGYKSQLQFSPREERAYLRSGYEYVFSLGSERNLIELQWQIVPRFYFIPFDIEPLFLRSIEVQLDNAPIQTLGREDLLLVLCAHAAKHEWSQVGMLRDIETLAQSELDWRWILHEARKLGILRILQISLMAVGELFRIPLPDLFRRDPPAANVLKAVQRLTRNLECDREPAIESFAYFYHQLQIRERRRTRLCIVWRLATTPSIAEWRSVRMPGQFFWFYRGIRILRLGKRLWLAAWQRYRMFIRRSHPLAHAHGSSIALGVPTPRGESPAAAPLLSNTEILPEYRSGQ